MISTATTSPPPRPTAAERFEQVAPVIAVRRVAGPSILLLVGPWLLLVLLLIPPAAVLLTLLVALALPFVAVALVVGVVASPYLLARAVHRRLAERRQPSERSAPVASRVAQIPALAPSAPMRRSQ
jgi:membrane protein implicated in regulation of membrane protease activity